MPHRPARPLVATLLGATLALTTLTAGNHDPTAGDRTVEVEEVDARIPASQPDDRGAPVSLDARLVVPAEGCPCPGIVWNHGFGGSKTGDGSQRRELASHGYVVLSYTSRGFGDTPGQVDLLGPKEQQDLLDAVDWLIDPDNEVVGGLVIPDAIGQIGASYGGLHAWALARSNHPAVRTVVPIATATNLYDAIAPNDVEMLAWANGFYATGYRPEDDNYSQVFHRVVHEMNTGVNNQDVQVELDARGVKGRWSNVRIPVYIIQGINDALFPANQAMEAFEELTSRGVDARLYLGGIGHPPAVTGGPEVEHLYDRVLQWMDHQLKGEQVPLLREPPIEIADTGYFDSVWDGTVRFADTLSDEDAATLHLCATGPAGGALSTEPCPDAPPVALTNTVAGSGLAEEPVTSGYLREYGFPTDAAPRGLVSFETAPVAEDTVLDLSGIPTFTLQASSVAQVPVDARGAVAAFQLDPKLYVVAPDGTASLLTRGAFAERIDATEAGSNPQHEVTFDAFAAFAQVPAGHRLRLTLATEDAPYLRPTTHPFAVTIHAGSTLRLPAGSWLSEPVVVGTPEG